MIGQEPLKGIAGKLGSVIVLPDQRRMARPAKKILRMTHHRLCRLGGEDFPSDAEPRRFIQALYRAVGLAGSKKDGTLFLTEKTA